MIHVIYLYLIVGAVFAGREIFAPESLMCPGPYFVEVLLSLVLACFLAVGWPFWVWHVYRSKEPT